MSTIQTPADKPRAVPSAKPASISTRLFYLVIGLAGVLMVVYLDGFLQQVKGLPTLSRDMSYGLLFVVGLFTGFHCVGMCGALVLSYTTKLASGRPSYLVHLLYGAGKTLSYTTIGALFGWFGSIVAFTPLLRGIIGIAAGIFLVLFGLGMLNVWPALKEVRFRTPPALLRFIGAQSRKYGHPFIIGLLNGLMILCGPLQAMYIMAAGSGSALQGAGMLLFFGLGTLPMMMGFGVFASLISRQLTPKLIKASAAIVVVLGAVMLNRGLKMSGSGLDLDTVRYEAVRSVATEWNHWQKKALVAGIELPEMPVPIERTLGHAAMAPMEIRAVVTAAGVEPNESRLMMGMPVRWTIEVREATPETARIVIPEWNLDQALLLGEQMIEFTPLQAGIVNWNSPSGSSLARFLVEDPNNSMMHVH
jgi:uncharacterized protein